MIGDNLDISYGEDECQQFAETIQFALANGVPVDLDIVLDGCERAIDDLDTWADDEVKAPLLRLARRVAPAARRGLRNPSGVIRSGRPRSFAPAGAGGRRRSYWPFALTTTCAFASRSIRVNASFISPECVRRTHLVSKVRV